MAGGKQHWRHCISYYNSQDDRGKGWQEILCSRWEMRVCNLHVIKQVSWSQICSLFYISGYLVPGSWVWEFHFCCSYHHYVSGRWINQSCFKQRSTDIYFCNWRMTKLKEGNERRGDFFSLNHKANLPLRMEPLILTWDMSAPVFWWLLLTEDLLRFNNDFVKS